MKVVFKSRNKEDRFGPATGGLSDKIAREEIKSGFSLFFYFPFDLIQESVATFSQFQRPTTRWCRSYHHDDRSSFSPREEPPLAYL